MSFLLVYSHFSHKRTNDDYLILQETLASVQARKINQKSRMITFKESLYGNYSTPGHLLPDTAFLTTLNGVKVKVSEITGSRKLFLFYSSGHCGECISQTLTRLESYSDSIGKENIILVGDYSNLVSAQAFVNENKIKFDFYVDYHYFKNKYFVFSNPVFFTLDEASKMENIFVSNKYMREEINMYLHLILNRYYRK